MDKKPTYTVESIHQLYDSDYEKLKSFILTYAPKTTFTVLDKAYNYAIEKHVKQVRKSGEPYFEHLFNVAKILSEFKLDVTTISCGLLHDVIEDTDVTPEELTSEFGSEICEMVDGVTKISHLSAKSSKVKQGENFRKMILSTAKDLRVILIKFADRLHNMRTLKHMPSEKRTRISIETRDVFAPLAHRFGLHKVKSELEDLSLKYLETEIYYTLKKKVEETRSQRDSYIHQTITAIIRDLEKVNIKVDIAGRPKHFHSIYNKMLKRKKPFEEIYDLLAIRIVTQEVSQCYFALGIVHSLYMPVMDRFKDYIATPKINGYQSLHTTVIGPDGKMVEIQIRTLEMHQHAEEGIAAHWRYKNAENNTNDENTQQKLNDHIKWLHQFVDRQNDIDSEDFIDNLKIDLFNSEVFVYSPKGDLFTLPKGSSILDFAFHIHSDVGLKCQTAKCNGKVVPLRTTLKNGDIVEIITSKNQRPNSDWLHFVATGKAKHYIKRWLKEAERENSIFIGKEVFSDTLKRHNISRDLIDLDSLVSYYKKNNPDQFYEAIGRSEISYESLTHHLKIQVEPDEKDDELPKATQIHQQKETIKALGIDNLLMNFGKCCNPIPGDIICGYVTSGHGITIHRDICRNLVQLEKKNETSRIIQLNWNSIRGENDYLVKINFQGLDRDYLMKDLSDALAELNFGIKAVNMDTDYKHNAFGHVLIFVKDVDQLDKAISTIQNVSSINFVSRDENLTEVR